MAYNFSYNPGVQDIRGQLRAPGLASMGQALGQGIQAYFQAKQQRDAAQGQLEGMAAADPSLANMVTQADPDGAKLWAKMQKGNATLSDTQRMLGMMSAYQGQKQKSLQMQQLQQAVGSTTNANNNADQMLQVRQAMAAAQPPAAAPSMGFQSGGQSPLPPPSMSYGGNAGNLAGAGVYSPAAQGSAADPGIQDILRARSLGQNLTPDVVQKLMLARMSSDDRMNSAQMRWGATMQDEQTRSQAEIAAANVRAQSQKAITDARIAQMQAKLDATNSTLQTFKVGPKTYVYHPGAQMTFDASTGQPVAKLGAGQSGDDLERGMRILAGSAGPSTGPKAPLTATQQQALTWAKANPSDPRASKILQSLGMQ